MAVNRMSIEDIEGIEQVNRIANARFAGKPSEDKWEETIDAAIKDHDSSSNGSPFKQFSLRGQSKEMRTQMLRDQFVLGRLALTGQITHIYAAPNTGKTLMTMWLLRQAIETRAIRPDRVFYINADDSFRGLTEKLELAEELGFEMIAPDHGGFNAKHFRDYIAESVEDGTAMGSVLILDTTKKFVDLMNKSRGADFGAVLRSFALKGGTVIGLSHVNKHKTADGKSVYSGTSDLVDDADCAYYLNDGGTSDGYKTVIFENFKNRGDVAHEASYKYRCDSSVPWMEKLNSIRSLNEDEIASAKAQMAMSESLFKDREAIDAIVSEISAKPMNQGELTSTLNERFAIGRRETIRILERYAGDNVRYGRFWSRVKGDNNATIITLNNGAQSHWETRKTQF